jgi:hypothetical protein
MYLNSLYDNRKPLEVAKHKALGRQVGVVVSGSFFHKGLNRECVEIHHEWPSFNTDAAGGPGVPVEDWQADVMRRLEYIIQKLDEGIAELQMHRARMQADLEAMLDVSG